jgi:hypothetical protein
MRDPDLLPPLEDQLPLLWQKPAYSVLLASLQKLRVKPRVWSPLVSRAGSPAEEQAAVAYDRQEIIQFLSGIIKSSLEWLGSDEQEVIWDEASKRMSERCGRTGMSALQGKAAVVWAPRKSEGTDAGSSDGRDDSDLGL